MRLTHTPHPRALGVVVRAQTRYTRAVLQHEHLVRAWLWHIATSVVGVGSFLVEDTAIEHQWPPVFHAAWHCLSAAAVGTATHELLNHLDGAGSAAGAAAGADA